MYIYIYVYIYICIYIYIYICIYPSTWAHQKGALSVIENVTGCYNQCFGCQTISMHQSFLLKPYYQFSLLITSSCSTTCKHKPLDKWSGNVEMHGRLSSTDRMHSNC